MATTVLLKSLGIYLEQPLKLDAWSSDYLGDPGESHEGLLTPGEASLEQDQEGCRKPCAYHACNKQKCSFSTMLTSMSEYLPVSSLAMRAGLIQPTKDTLM